MTWDNKTKSFGLQRDGSDVIRTQYDGHLWTFKTCNIGSITKTKNHVATKRKFLQTFPLRIVLQTSASGTSVLGIYARSRLMNDRGLAKGIMLKHRGKIECTDCHFGKQRRKTFWNALDRKIKQDNEVIFADLLFPGVHNGSPYSAVLVIMDGYSHYVRTYLLKSKTEGEVNGHMTD